MNDFIIKRTVDKIKEYFETNPNQMLCVIKKGVLCNMAQIGMTQTEVLSQVLESKTSSIKNLRGRILIEREDFMKFAETFKVIEETKENIINASEMEALDKMIQLQNKEPVETDLLAHGIKFLWKKKFHKDITGEQALEMYNKRKSGI